MSVQKTLEALWKMLWKKLRRIKRKQVVWFLKTAAIAVGVVGVIGFCALAVTVAAFMKSLPSPEEIDSRQVSQSTKIFDRTGEVLLYEIHGEEKRTVISWDEIPEKIKQATIAIEDQNFYNHPAFDWRGILRALVSDALHLGIRQGGSTITQQLAKNAFLTNEKTLPRKIKELLLALQLEKQYTKDQILNLYLNQIPYGGNAYGVEAAAKTYFGVSAKDVDLAEAATLASLPQSTTYYSPWGPHLDDLIARKNFVLDQMAKLGYITNEERDNAKKEELKFEPQASSIKAPHFVMAVQDYLNNKYGNDTLENGGLKVITTLDWKLQQVAEKAVEEGAKRNEQLYKGKNAALFAEDPRTGQVLSVVGSRDYFDVANEGNFNVAMQGLRQPGSSFKPFAYVTAFQEGYTPDTVLFDLETEFDTTGIPSRSYKPQDFDGVFRGPISLRNALAQSINIPAVKIMYLAGIDNVLKTAQNFGITTLTERSRYGLSLVLGGGEVKLSEMVGAYSVFATEGIKHDQTLVLSVQDSKGQELEKYNDKATNVIDPQYPRLINGILSDVDARSPLFENSLNLTKFGDHDVALKTGTTNNYVDAWAIGYTPSLVAGVWAGNNHREPLQKKGGSILAAVPIWSEFMKQALATATVEYFTKPDPISVTKPVLRGEYIQNKQLHSILYYVDKRDPQGPYPTNPESDSQFQNWETPILNWGRATIPDFNTYNQGGLPQSGGGSDTITLSVSNPQKGTYVSSTFPLAFNVSATEDLDSIEVDWNGGQIDKLQVSGNSYTYNKIMQVTGLDVQNILTIKIVAKSSATTQQDIILFK